jgi:predicted negative regulator of RcsB-dependent stress response
MATYDLEEQEQIENLKAWWNRYGNTLTIVICLLAAAVIGWQGWQWRQNQISGEASVLFANLQGAISTNDTQKIRLITGELTGKYGSTSFASLGLMLAARHAVLVNDTDTARLQLAWVAKQGGHELADLARFRLAGLLLDIKDYEGAKAELAHSPAQAYVALYAELRGDVAVMEGDVSAAKIAYEEAIRLQEEKSQREAAEADVAAPSLAVSPLLLQKRDALNGAA